MGRTLHDGVREVLSGPQRTVFDFLVRNPGPQKRDYLARACGWEPTSGHVKNVLGSLRTLEVIDYPSCRRSRAAGVAAVTCERIGRG
jgi:hypothetical protein